MAEPLLVLSDVRAGYGSAIVLDGVSLEMPANGSLAVLGRNGVGKSTLLLTIMGFTDVKRGAIAWRGRDITRTPAHRRALDGIGWSPRSARSSPRSASRKTSWSPRDPARGTSPPSTISFPGSRSGGATAATICRAASSRCWRWRAR
jgi:ABC-type glutathione transport system ATPase component